MAASRDLREDFDGLAKTATKKQRHSKSGEGGRSKRRQNGQHCGAKAEGSEEELAELYDTYADCYEVEKRNTQEILAEQQQEQNNDSDNGGEEEGEEDVASMETKNNSPSSSQVCVHLLSGFFGQLSKNFLNKILLFTLVCYQGSISGWRGGVWRIRGTASATWSWTRARARSSSWNPWTWTTSSGGRRRPSGRGFECDKKGRRGGNITGLPASSRSWRPGAAQQGGEEEQRQ